jgi:hypothetical protein
MTALPVQVYPPDGHRAGGQSREFLFTLGARREIRIRIVGLRESLVARE